MRKIILFLLFLGISDALFPLSKSLLEYEEPMAVCIGDIIFHIDIDPDLCLYYKGNKLQLDINHDKKSKKLGQINAERQLVKIVPYTLSEEKATQTFHMLICCRPEFASQLNTVTYLYVPQQVTYKFYTISGARKYDKQGKVEGCTWAVTEEYLLDDRIIPDNTIIFLFNADFIDGVEVKSWPLNSNVRLLPSIIIKKTIEPQLIIRAIVEARLAAIDFDAIHSKSIQPSIKRENKTVVTIKS